NEAANAVFAARYAHDHLAFGGERRERHVIAVLPGRDARLPGDLPRGGLERHHTGIDGCEIDLVAVKPDAAIGRMQLEQLFRELALVAPEHIARFRRNRNHLILRRADIHDAVIDDRGCFVAFLEAGGKAPYRSEILDVLGGDLVEGAVAPALIIAA